MRNNYKFSSTKVIPLGSTAFRQPNATSHCKYLHGYRLQAKFWFSCNELDSNNWVVDFGGLKELKKKLEDWFDHTTCIWSKDPELEIFKSLHDKGIIDLRIFKDGVGIEKFAQYSLELANEVVTDLTKGRCWCTKVEVWEHESNSATYELDQSLSCACSTPVEEKPAVETPTPLTETIVTPPPVVQTKTSTEKGSTPPLYNTKTYGTYKDPFAGTMWGNTPRK